MRSCSYNAGFLLGILLILCLLSLTGCSVTRISYGTTTMWSGAMCQKRSVDSVSWHRSQNDKEKWEVNGVSSAPDEVAMQTFANLVGVVSSAVSPVP